MSGVRPHPYGTVVVDSDGETIMLLGFGHVEGAGHLYEEGLRLCWGDYADPPQPRDVPNGLIDYEDEFGTRYKVQE